MTGEPETWVSDAVYVESPRWHDGALWFSDIGAGKVRRVWADGRQEVVVDSIVTPSGLGWTAEGDLLVASIEDSTVYRVGADGVPHVFSGPTEHGTLATNDMATRDRRSYVTCSGRIYEPGDTIEDIGAPVGTILLLDHAEGTGRVVASGLCMPNGVDITADGDLLVVAEVFARRILTFRIEEGGLLSAPSTFVTLPYNPDGLCVDAEGGVWVGATAEERFERFGRDGKVTHAIPVPGWSCIAPMIGGDSLFMAVNRFKDADDIFQGRAKGRVLRVGI